MNDLAQLLAVMAFLVFAIVVSLKRRPIVQDPAVGQIWISGFNGSVIRVTEAKLGDTGILFVTVERRETPEDRWSIGYSYSVGVNQWRYRIAAERRTLATNVKEMW